MFTTAELLLLRNTVDLQPAPPDIDDEDKARLMADYEHLHNKITAILEKPCPLTHPARITSAAT